MKVKDLIAKLREFDPDLPVVGYCERSEDDFIVTNVVQSGVTEGEIDGIYNQGVSVAADMADGQPVVVIL